MNKDLVLFIKREHLISSRILSEDKDRILRSTKIIDVKISIVIYTNLNKDSNKI